MRERLRHRPSASWYYEYWYEREHSPDLAFLVARLVRSLFRRLGPLARQLLTIANRHLAEKRLVRGAGREPSFLLSRLAP
jgi:hypothetical protein